MSTAAPLRCAVRGRLLYQVPFPLEGKQRRSGIALFPPAERDVKLGQNLSPYLITQESQSRLASRRASLCLPTDLTHLHTSGC